MYRILITVLLAAISLSAYSQYNDNIKRKVLDVSIYTGGDYIYFRLENPPTHPSCNNANFVIAESVPYERRQMLLSRLLMAYATQEAVNIGFDNAGNCVHGYVRVHRVG